MLCYKADINRSTFYSHYRTLEDVLDEIEDEFCRHISYISEKGDDSENRTEFLRYMKYVEKHKDQLIILLKNDRIIGSVVEKSIESYCSDRPKADAEEIGKHRFYVRYACSGTYRLLEEWVRNPDIISANEVADIILEIAEEIGKIEEKMQKRY